MLREEGELSRTLEVGIILLDLVHNRFGLPLRLDRLADHLLRRLALEELVPEQVGARESAPGTEVLGRLDVRVGEGDGPGARDERDRVGRLLRGLVKGGLRVHTLGQLLLVRSLSEAARRKSLTKARRAWPVSGRECQYAVRRRKEEDPEPTWLELGERVVGLALSVLFREARLVVAEHRVYASSQSATAQEEHTRSQIRLTVKSGIPPQANLVLSLLDLSARKGDLNALLLLVDADVLGGAGRLGLELRRTEDRCLEDERRRSVQGQVRDGLVNGDGDLGRSGEGEVLQVGTDREIVVNRPAREQRTR